MGPSAQTARRHHCAEGPIHYPGYLTYDGMKGQGVTSGRRGQSDERWEDDDMRTQIMRCSCGVVIRGEEEELYSQARNHVDRTHPDEHRLYTGHGTGEAVRAAHARSTALWSTRRRLRGPGRP